jgi:type II secretory pathway component PulF
MTARQAHELTAAVAAVTSEGLPLTDGLRAAASEASSDNVARELRRIADEIQSGRSLEETLGEDRAALPSYLAGLIRAALRTGNVGEVLIELIDHQQTVRDMWWTIRSALTYPVLLLVVTGGIAIWMQFFLLGPMIQMFEDFGLELPSITQFLAWWHRDGFGLFLSFAAIIASTAILFRAFAGAARWRRAVGTLPIVGVLWHWSGVAELSRVLAVLVEQGVPLPEALRLASGGTSDADMSQLSRQLADEVERGRRLSELIAGATRLPPTLVPIVEWGEQTGQLADAFRRAGEMFEGRVAMRAELVKSIGPPVLFIVVASIALIAIFGLYMPLISMIQALS